MKNVNIPIIVDEMNVIHQLHKINVHGLSWTNFYKTLGFIANAKVTPYFACANVERKDKVFHANRSTFFNALRKRGVNVLEGLAVRESKDNRIEKGVDVLVALQIYKEALKGARDIIVCSADSDLVPAVKEAQNMGVRVHVVMSDYTPGCELSTIADRVISLETIVQSMVERGKINFKNQEKPYLFTNAVCYKQQRKGLQYA
ncbi:NYN domain-containing protein [Lysinibacillus sp. K60]|uniref:NYN domain-containing protein n=1 Tax=Lysinibacillus sp. K60 TaxID=2720027 RepID=UPI001C8C911E|nr:NYN domain-containing protein [Lysinibacillus sp. K60]MBX8945906.1 NYN domain-containing protein [Lysinibacillus sp. K60]